MNIAIVYSSTNVPEFFVDDTERLFLAIHSGAKTLSKALRENGCSLTHRVLLEHIAKSLSFSDLHQMQQELERKSIVAHEKHIMFGYPDALQVYLNELFSGQLAACKTLLSIQWRECGMSLETVRLTDKFCERLAQRIEMDSDQIRVMIAKLMKRESWDQLRFSSATKTPEGKHFKWIVGKNILGQKEVRPERSQFEIYEIFDILCACLNDRTSQFGYKAAIEYWQTHLKQRASSYPECLFTAMAHSRLSKLGDTFIKDIFDADEHYYDLFDQTLRVCQIEQKYNSGYWGEQYVKASASYVEALLCRKKDELAHKTVNWTLMRVNKMCLSYNVLALFTVVGFLSYQFTSQDFEETLFSLKVSPGSRFLALMIRDLRADKSTEAKKNLLRAYGADPTLLLLSSDSNTLTVADVSNYRREWSHECDLCATLINIAKFRYWRDIDKISSHPAVLEMLDRIQEECEGRSSGLERAIESNLDACLAQVPKRWHRIS